MQVRVMLDGAIATLEALRTRSFEEASVDHGEAGPVLMALVSGGLGWLMYMDEPGSDSLQSSNPQYDGDGNATIKYRLSNGQVDEYPACWAYDLASVRRALLEFAETKKAPASIRWR